MSEGISYDWIVNAKLEGVEAGTKKIDAAAASTSKLDAGTTKLSADTQFLGGKLDVLATHLEKSAAGHRKNTEETKKHSEGFKGIGHAVDEAKGKMTSFFEFTGAMIAFESLKRVTEGVIDLGKEIVNAAAGEERTKKSFELNFGVEGGKEALEYAERFSRHTEFTEDQSKAFIAPLLNAGVPLKQMDMYMAAAGDSASKFQNKLEGMATTIEALRRVELSGKLDGRTARALNIGVPQLAELDEYKGKSDKQLKKILSDGSLSKEQLFRVIAGRDGKLGDQAVEMSETMGAKLDKLGALPERLFQEFMNAPAFDALKDKIDGILETLDPSAPGGQKIIDGIGKVGEAIVDVIGKIDFDSVADTIRDDIIPVVKEMVHILGIAVDTVGGFAKGVKLLTGSNADRHEFGRQFDEGMSKIIARNVDSGSWVDRFTPLGYIKAKFESHGKSAGEGLAAGMASSKVDAASAASDLAMSSVDAAQSTLDIHSPSRKFAQLGRYSGEGYAEGLGESRSDIADAMDGAMATPQPTRSARAILGSVSLGGVHITIAGRGDDEDRTLAQRVGAAIMEIVPPMLVQALEGVAMESGAA